MINIEKARAILGLSQKELANALGWKNYQQVSNLERGRREATKQTELAIECLMRRAEVWHLYAGEEQKTMEI